MSGVFLYSPTNSQMFTTCCQTAICDDQRQCPRCKAFVYPDDEDDEQRGVRRSNHERAMSRWNSAYRSKALKQGYGR